MAEDPRHRTLEYYNTYLTAANILKPDGVTPLSFHVQFSTPNYPLKWLFYGKAFDAVFIVETAETTPVVDWEGSVIGYQEKVPTTIYVKSGATVDGVKARWQCEKELRRIVETYPISSTYRSLQRMSDNETDMGGWRLYSVNYVLTYQRDTA